MCYKAFFTTKVSISNVWKWSDDVCTTKQIYPILFGHNLITTLRQTKPSAIQWLQCAFECRVIGVSCISHRLTQLAAFFLDQRAEWSTTGSSYFCFLQFFAESQFALYQCFWLNVFQKWKRKYLEPVAPASVRWRIQYLNLAALVARTKRHTTSTSVPRTNRNCRLGTNRHQGGPPTKLTWFGLAP